jgi:hypothetical protein
MSFCQGLRRFRSGLIFFRSQSDGIRISRELSNGEAQYKKEGATILECYEIVAFVSGDHLPFSTPHLGYLPP